MFETNSLLIGLVFGSIGVGYCIYGRKQKNFIVFMTGVLLMGLPYVIDNNKLLVIVSLLLMAIPKFLK